MAKIIVVSGPTASGKTKYAIEIAKYFNGEIVSCDSMQLYKYMTIGSAKPTKEEQAEVKHYLVDEIDPRIPFSVKEYQSLANKAIDEVLSLGKVPVIEGGTGLYLNSLIYNMDFNGSDFSNVSGSNNRNTNHEFILICLTRDRDELYARINRRVDIMVESGLFDEVKSLMDIGLTEDNISMKGIGYKEVITYFNGEVSMEDAIDNIKKNTRHYAKRQLTWFKRYDDMKWFNLSGYSDFQRALADIINYVEGKINGRFEGNQNS